MTVYRGAVFVLVEGILGLGASQQFAGVAAAVVGGLAGGVAEEAGADGRLLELRDRQRRHHQ